MAGVGGGGGGVGGGGTRPKIISNTQLAIV